MNLDEQMESLIERVERAEGGDREIDWLVYQVMFPDDPVIAQWHDQIGKWSATDAASWATRFTNIRPYSSSLDAVLGLVEEKLPGDLDPNYFYAETFNFMNMVSKVDVEKPIAPQMARIVLAALLKALESQAPRPIQKEGE